MFGCDELKKFAKEEEAEYVQPQRKSLLSKYEIPIQHLDFSYVENCSDGKELEKILDVLRSQEEGFFPELIAATEEKLRQTKPKSKLLRVTTQVLSKDALDGDERNQLANDLGKWIETVTDRNKELETYKSNSDCNLKIPIRQNKPADAQTKQKTDRIKSTDYESWDKYDVDSELLKMELKEERLKKEIKKPQEENEFVTNFATDAEAAFVANKQKTIGNEFFRSSDYNEAIKHYSHSIQALPTAAAYTNRALCYIKLGLHEESVADCSEALILDPSNIKAHLRKADCEEKLGHYQRAIESVDVLLKLDPNNCTIQTMASRLAKYRKETSSKTRLTIKDIENEENCKLVVKKVETLSSRCEIIPIPGTSKMLPPYFKIVNSEDPNVINLEKRKIYDVPHLMYIATIDNSSGDEANQVEHESRKMSSVKVKSRQPVRKKWDKKKLRQNFSAEVTQKSQENEQILLNDRGGGGEPCTKGTHLETITSEDLNMPFTFLKAWNSVSKDTSYIKHAEIIKNLDRNRIVQIIGYKLNSTMLSGILTCMSLHLMEAQYIEIVYGVLVKLTEIPRFSITKMFLSGKDKDNFTNLVDFLNNYGYPLEENIIQMYCNH